MEKYADGYVAYPLGIERTVVDEGDTDEEALGDETALIEAFIAEAKISA